MSFIFGGVRGRSDPELEAANRRHRIRLARDINDVRTLNDPDAGAAPRRRGRHWLLLAIVAAVLGVLAVVGGRSDDVPITASCTTPDIAVASSSVAAGAPLQYRLTGPDHTRYVVTVDGDPVRGDAGSTGTDTNTAAGAAAGAATATTPVPARGPAWRLQPSRPPPLAAPPPAGNGPHELAVLEVAD